MRSFLFTAEFTCLKESIESTCRVFMRLVRFLNREYATHDMGAWFPTSTIVPNGHQYCGAAAVFLDGCQAVEVPPDVRPR